MLFAPVSAGAAAWEITCSTERIPVLLKIQNHQGQSMKIYQLTMTFEVWNENALRAVALGRYLKENADRP